MPELAYSNQIPHLSFAPYKRNLSDAVICNLRFGTAMSSAAE